MYFFPMALKTILPIDLAVCGEGGIKKSDYYIQSSGGTKREVGHIQINTNFKYKIFLVSQQYIYFQMISDFKLYSANYRVLNKCLVDGNTEKNISACGTQILAES